MRDTTGLRQSTLAAFTTLFLLTSASSISRPECINTRSQELASLASCGDVGSLNYCFSHLVSQQSNTPVEQLTSELETCFQNAGCTLAESQIEALWTLQRCDSDLSELRRRRGAEGVAAMPIPRAASPGGGITILAARQGNDATTAPPASANPASPTTVNKNSPSPCFTETSISITSCPTQSTGPNAGKKLSCFETSVPSQVCAAGLICQVDAQGSPSCMFKQSSLDLAGIIIAIFFVSAIVISIVSICFFCCRERRVQNRLIRAAEAAKIAQEAKTAALVNAKKSGSSGAAGAGGDGQDRQPLMSQAPELPPLPQQYPGSYQGAPGTEYGGAHGSNPFADSHDSHPLR